MMKSLFGVQDQRSRNAKETEAKDKTPPTSERGQPRTNRRIKKAAEDAKENAPEDDERDRAAHGDFAHAIPVRGRDALHATAGCDSREPHHETRAEAAHDDPNGHPGETARRDLS
jgi:hypothetical protein